MVSDGAVRPASANYHPTVWGDYFILQQFPPSTIDEKSEAWIKERVAELVRQVKILLKNSKNQLEVIDTLERLGVGYHFEKEFDVAFKKIHNDNIDDANDLHYGALRFRLLRQHGYHFLSDVFNKFKDEDQGQLKANLGTNNINDVKGLFAIYEAAYVSTPDEELLADAAANFAKNHLKALMQNNAVGPTLSAQISNSLYSPLVRRMPRLEARNYIDIYQLEENINEVVLELAKLDFHLLQLLHREEVKIICKWWKELGIIEKMTFTRDRVVECYFWVLGVYFEPHYSRARILMTKIILHFSAMDDIYDCYGTLEELKIYRDLVERWGLEGVDQLTEVPRLHFLALYDTIKNIENELEIEGLSYRVPYLKEAIRVCCRAWFTEAEWRDAGYVPPLKEYLQVSLYSDCYPSLACVSFVGMGQIATQQAFDWVLSFPKIVQAMSTICRLMDDIVSFELEGKRLHVASAVQCYMKENGGTAEEACEALRKMIEHSWKEFNREYLTESKQISKHLLMRLINLNRIMETLYKDFDAYTESGTTLRAYITQLLVQPIL